MSIKNQTIYSVLDTSQLINLFNAKNISFLNSSEFVKVNGFPLIFYEHLLELAKIDCFDRFSKNLSMLEAVNTFKTFKTNKDLPDTIFMLLEKEIFLYSKFGRIDIDILKGNIPNDIVDYKFNIQFNNRLILYDKLKEEAMKESLISVLPGNLTNPNFKKKIEVLEKNKTKIEPMDNIESLKSVLKFMDKRLKNKSEINNLMDIFCRFQDDKKRETKSALVLAGEYSDKKINQNQTSEDVLYNNLFSEIKRLTIETYKINDIANLTYDDLIINKIYFRGNRYLANIHIKDTKRKIESSNIFDICFLCCSALFNVFVDKRTFDLGERMKKELGIDLKLEKVISK
jgi:hypothetical protein